MLWELRKVPFLWHCSLRITHGSVVRLAQVGFSCPGAQTCTVPPQSPKSPASPTHRLISSFLLFFSDVSLNYCHLIVKIPLVTLCLKSSPVLSRVAFEVNKTKLLTRTQNKCQVKKPGVKEMLMGAALAS